VAAAWWSLVKFGFRLLYNEFAFSYDWVSHVVSLGAWRCWQRAALKHLRVPEGSLLLELAHGTGNLQLDLRALGLQAVGYDLSPYMGQIARRKMQQAGLPVRLARGRAQQLPFADGSFVAVISTFPTNFILENETLSEVYRVLQPGGQFLIVPNGVLNSGGAAEAGIEWLYRVTGQREAGAFDVNSFFEQHGFSAEILQESCPRSVATVIVARKKLLWNIPENT
jgi:ubiquinone/menaquinone biosynthesis C-methylase UbiE